MLSPPPGQILSPATNLGLLRSSTICLPSYLGCSVRERLFGPTVHRLKKVIESATRGAHGPAPLNARTEMILKRYHITLPEVIEHCSTAASKSTSSHRPRSGRGSARFERMWREPFVHHDDLCGLTGPADWTRWGGTGRNRRPTELGLLARGDGRILIGGVRWSAQPVEGEVPADFVRDVEDFGSTGKGRASRARSEERLARQLYLLAAGFAPDRRECAPGASSVRLVFVADSYPARTGTEREAWK